MTCGRMKIIQYNISSKDWRFSNNFNVLSKEVLDKKKTAPKIEIVPYLFAFVSKIDLCREIWKSDH